MSWIMNPDGVAPKAEPQENMIQDPFDPTRKVTKKTANQPFLAYQSYKEQQEKDHQAWVKKKEERDTKISRGEKVGPLERDPTAQEEVGLLGLLKFIVYTLIIIALAGKFFTGHYLWEYDGKWVQLKTYWPSGDRLFSEGFLAQFDGADEDKPIYLAIDHVVYDVSSNRRTYGPGGSYHHMAGVDAARSFGTGCFATHRTHDLRGLSDSELKSVDHWKKFFTEHKSYFKVGKVIHPPIDPASPIPEHCDPKKEEARRQKKDNKERPDHPPPKDEKAEREEL
ncbi:cytochrome b5-like heme/steroid binding domain-containing protein [Hygrophoropsis aurantiaca]|uniref:Cytochrome b5-like heme/steroid binding domain-containing protein n=1 Tax=Hygrophoropsis aurantiaca TaxID=72124 RepID=A0ACB8ASY7_9AGAM|nr:cytochrome b5-like heme/steroid binding domain-containing protein [Hygrophoropsis aurantiaca]